MGPFLSRGLSKTTDLDTVPNRSAQCGALGCASGAFGGGGCAEAVCAEGVFFDAPVLRGGIGDVGRGGLHPHRGGSGGASVSPPCRRGSNCLAFRPMSEDLTSVTLSDGATLTLNAGADALEIRRAVEGATPEALALPWPRRGFAGGDFCVSPSERYVVLSMYSGQSEEGYELLALDPLRHISGLPYVYGFLSSFAFSPDESRLVMALLQDCSDWWIAWEDEAELEEDGRMCFPVGGVHLHDIASGHIDACRLLVRVPASWRPPSSHEALTLAPRFSESAIVLDAPWGRTRIPTPLPAVWAHDIAPRAEPAEES